MHSTAETFPEGASCRPNFSGAGRRRRRNVAIGGGVTAILVLAAVLGLGLPPAAGLLVTIPAGVFFVSGLQVVRNTCVAHAATGRIEHDDFTTSEVEDAAFAAASRKVAATIWRDGILGAVAAGLASAVLAWLF